MQTQNMITLSLIHVTIINYNNKVRLQAFSVKLPKATTRDSWESFQRNSEVSLFM